MRPRQNEIRKITPLLEQEWDDVDDLAREVVRQCYEMILERDWWTVVMHDKRLGAFAFGPFETQNMAKKAIGKTVVAPGPEPAAGYIQPLLKGSSE